MPPCLRRACRRFAEGYRRRFFRSLPRLSCCTFATHTRVLYIESVGSRTINAQLTAPPNRCVKRYFACVDGRPVVASSSRHRSLLVWLRFRPLQLNVMFKATTSFSIRGRISRCCQNVLFLQITENTRLETLQRDFL